MSEAEPDVTQILHRAAAGDAAASERLWDAMYAQVHRIAARQLRAERSDHTLSPTGLVHEAYLRLVDQREVEWADRAHFYRIAARMCRRVLVDHARRRGALRRGGDRERTSLDTRLAEQLADSGGLSPDEVVALDDALDELGRLSPRLAAVVEMRYFAGLTEEETATTLAVTPRTVRRDWIKARGFLHDAIFGEADPPSGDDADGPVGGNAGA